MAIHGKRRIFARRGLIHSSGGGRLLYAVCRADAAVYRHGKRTADINRFRLFCAPLLCAFVIRPIPIKVTTITVLYFLTFADRRPDSLHHALSAPGFAPWNWLHASGVPVLAATALTLLYGFLHGRRIALKRYRIRVTQPPWKASPALISDLHMESPSTPASSRASVRFLSSQAPDILLLAGDLCDDQTTPSDMLAACALLGGHSHEVWSILCVRQPRPRRSRPRAEVPWRKSTAPRSSETESEFRRRLRYHFRPVHRGRAAGTPGWRIPSAGALRLRNC